MSRCKIIWALRVFQVWPSVPPHLVKKWRHLVLSKQGLEPRLLSWQHHTMYNFVSYLTYITGAKFEWHQRNISRDFVCIFLLKLFVKNLNILGMKEDLSKKNVPFLLTFKGLSNKQTYFCIS